SFKNNLELRRLVRFGSQECFLRPERNSLGAFGKTALRTRKENSEVTNGFARVAEHADLNRQRRQSSGPFRHPQPDADSWPGQESKQRRRQEHSSGHREQDI